jgi:HPt (histidine-containing phosphotransfer) domain-containing protein
VREDFNILSQTAHALKSSRAIIEAPVLSDFSKDFEETGRQDKVSKNQMLMAELEAFDRELSRPCEMNEGKNHRRWR